MEHHSGSDQPTVHHESGLKTGTADSNDSHPQNPDLVPARDDAQALTDGLPRMFALVQEFADDGEEIITEIVAYGLALPCGVAATVGVTGHGFGRWISAYSAASRLRSDLLWLGESGT